MVVTRDTLNKTLEDAVRRIIRRFEPEKIVLFGSVADGVPGPDSDIDLLIIMQVENSTRQKANEIDLLLSDRAIPMDFLVLTPEQYQQQRHIPGSIFREVESKGLVLYERAA